MHRIALPHISNSAKPCHDISIIYDVVDISVWGMVSSVAGEKSGRAGESLSLAQAAVKGLKL